ncbi:hypothetical protein AVEN_42804-1 [Araneus ventricosus]|uniref:Uncharacterized protein n=1 Tax=Araneus ventricosus TaxID=182803 RepID=A0A4Y2AH07_ARAVE|nr:hypothetical protein AVEN_42804-1 [Araneus ventricosus]
MLMLRHHPQHGAPTLGDPHHLSGPPVDLSGHYAAFAAGQPPFTHSCIPSGGLVTIESFSSNVSQKPPWEKHFLNLSADTRFQELVKSSHKFPCKWSEKFLKRQSLALVENEGSDNSLLQN